MEKNHEKFEQKPFWVAIITGGNAVHRQKFISLKIEDMNKNSMHVLNLYTRNWNNNNKDEVEKEFQQVFKSIKEKYMVGPLWYYTNNKWRAYIKDFTFEDPMKGIEVLQEEFKWVIPPQDILS